MTADISRARGNSNGPIKVPIYDAPNGTAYADIATYPVVNQFSTADGDSILSVLGGTGYTDVEGATAIMVAKIGDKEYRDKVVLIGEKQNVYVVEIDGIEYAVRKSIVRFIKA